MNERTFQNALNIIRNYLSEDAPTMNTDPGKTGTTGFSPESSPTGPVAGNYPPVDLRKKRYKNLPGPFKDLFRRTQSVQSKYPR
jgi:hypothetical protein